MKQDFQRPDEVNMRALLAREPDSPVGAILRLAWLQGLSREEILKLTWSQVDFTNGVLYLPDRHMDLDEDTARCLRVRHDRYADRSEFVVISDKNKRPMTPVSVSRQARAALDSAGLTEVQLKDLRRDFFFRQAELHDWTHAVRVCGFSVSTYHSCFAGAVDHKRKAPSGPAPVDEFRLWQILQREKHTAEGIALWMSWQMGVQAKDLVSLTWSQVDFARGVLRLDGGEAVPMTRAVQQLLEAERAARGPSDDPHVLLSPVSKSPVDVSRLSKLVQTALIRGGLEDVTLRDVRAAGELKKDEEKLLQWAAAKGQITRGEVMDLLGVSDTAAYQRLRKLRDQGKLEQMGNKYYLPGTVVPEERQWAEVRTFLEGSGFAYSQDIADILHVNKRKAAAIMKRFKEEGKVTLFEKRYYLAKEPANK